MKISEKKTICVAVALDATERLAETAHVILVGIPGDHAERKNTSTTSNVFRLMRSLILRIGEISSCYKLSNCELLKSIRSDQTAADEEVTSTPLKETVLGLPS